MKTSMWVGSLALAVCVVFSVALPAHAASCPVSLDVVVAVGKTASGHEIVYHASVGGDNSVSKTMLTVASAGAKKDVDAAINWSGVAGPATWFAIPAAFNAKTVAIKSVTKSGATIACGDTPPTPISSGTGGGPLTVYGESSPAANFDDETYDAGPQLVKGVTPNYSLIAIPDGITGTMGIEVEVGTDGKPTTAWVRWARTSGIGIASLPSGPALTAALSSTFSPAVIDGRNSVWPYFIESVLGENGRFATDYVGELDTQCPLAIVESHVDPPNATDPTAWYFFTARSQAGGIVAATLWIEDDKGKTYSVPWYGFTFGPPNPRYGGQTAEGLLTWPDTSIRKLWIGQVTTLDGKNVDCDPDVDEPQAMSAFPPVRSEIGTPPQISSVQFADIARFTDEVWPAYPLGADGKRVDGTVTVEAFVDASGNAIDAFVTHSSGRRELDQAGLDAATASTYQPSSNGAVKLVEVSYRFVE